MTRFVSFIFRIRFQFLCVLAATVIRAVCVFSDAEPLSDIVFVISLAVFGALTAVPCFYKKSYAPAFSMPKSKAFGFLSYGLSFGLFADFINRCVSAAQLLSDSAVFSTSLVIRVVTALSALISSVYFIVIGLSLSGSRYDFKSLKLIHIMPILWAGFCIMEGFENAGANGINSLLKYVMLSISLMFFYYSAREIDSEDGAMRISLVSSRLLTFTSFLYFADTFFMSIKEKTLYGGFESTLALTALFMLLYSFAFERNIIINTTENSIV
ncbi:MAG: hypothetical protein K6C14_03900 [Eubacterium sp.]|nr:hypothetical protein [Eubacterium sp.]